MTIDVHKRTENKNDAGMMQIIAHLMNSWGKITTKTKI